MRQTILGLSGPIGCGKDTAAGFLVKNHDFFRIGFADAVREAALVINPVLETNWQVDASDETSPRLNYYRLQDAVDQFGWDKAKRILPEARRLLMVIGSDMGRNIFDEDCWVNIAKRKAWAQEKNVVISDCRFPNEVEWIRHTGGVIVRVERPNNPNAVVTEHISEKYVPEADFVLVNSGSLEYLEQSVTGLWQSIQQDQVYEIGG